ncbi:acyltransferase family protein [Herbaspirillum seropedicae]|uniref:acyltransferase family protein n=1 Tax=Herbaspirillum seropedicae TaxID=964 RepID=UPI000863A3F7|nr:acyltransferase [Herbaspirillum seropedicae]AON56462.1 hypothetical protein Hsc_4204 [Herbaspirillum seropedicae]
MGLIRLYLALSVLLHHCHFPGFGSPSHLDGGVAVILFYIISGFYITFILHEKYYRLENCLSAFYYGRLVRIFPLYLIVLLFCILFYRSINQPSIFTDSLGLSLEARGLIVLSNLVVFGQDLFNVVVEDIQNGSPITGKVAEILNDNGAIGIRSDPVYVLIGQAWSLAVELCFYLFAPFIVRSKARIVILLLASLCVRFALLGYGFPSVPYSIRFFPSVLLFFLMGGLGYHIYRGVSAWNLPLARKIGGFLLLVSGILVAATVHLSIKFLPGADFDTVRHWAVYVTLALAIPFVFLYSKDARIDAFLGEFSYPVYLIHGLVLGYMVQPIHGLTISGPLLVIAYSLFFSWLLICAVIRPSENAKNRKIASFIRKRPSP